MPGGTASPFIAQKPRHGASRGDRRRCHRLGAYWSRLRRAVPLRLASAEGALRGEKPGEKVFCSAAAAAAATIEPLEDPQTDAQVTMREPHENKLAN